MRSLEDILAWLYVPAPRAAELLAKAAEAADGIVVDLEDAVHPRQRPAARAHLAEALPAYDGTALVVVRVNPVSTDDFTADIDALTPLVRAGHVAAVRIAKVESAEEVAIARAATAAWGPEPRLICQLESAGAVTRAHEIAAADGVHSIMLGEADLRADLRLPRGAAGDPGLLLARQTCVLAARAAGLPSPVGSAFTDVTDTEGLRETSARLAGLGFVGRSCIHPKQTALVREGFAPSPGDIAWATSVLTESDAQDGVETASSVLADGSFVDPAIVRQAERIAARSGGAAMSGIGMGRLDGADVIVVDLAQPLHPAVPVSPSHPGFKHSLQRRHGDAVRVDGTSGANDLLVLGTHTATHVDALAHISHDGLLHGGVDARAAQEGGRFMEHGVHTVAPVVAPGVLLDLPAYLGVERLVAGQAITAEDLAGAAAGHPIDHGAVIMVRTGWAQLWEDPTGFLSHDDGVPGPDEGACEWLVAQAPRLVGSDTTAFEHIPAGEGHARLPGHRVLLVEAGVPIMEMLQLERLAGLAPQGFTIVAAPLPIIGATGSPLRPLALVGA